MAHPSKQQNERMRQNLHRQNRAAQPIKEHEGYTVNSHISAREAYLIFWVEMGAQFERGVYMKGGGGGGGREGVFISFFKFRPETNIVFISSKHEL